MKHWDSKIFIIAIALVFMSLTIVFDLLPRSTFSTLERRELADVPAFSIEKVRDGSLMEEISAWFSDTEPFRDEFLTLSMAIQSNMDIKRLINISDDEAIAFHASEADTESFVEDHTKDDIVVEADSIGEYVNTYNAAEENTKMANRGILVVGTAPTARALMAFGASATAGKEFANLVSKYQEQLPGVQVYCMVIPNAIEFYCPDKARNVTKSQRDVINNIYQHLSSGARGIDCYTPLSQHVAEDIFLRTDHHWAPRGAYYAAEAFAKVAGVPFSDLSTYEEKTVHDFVGTMYGYSKDIAIRHSPEDFVYYVPTGVDYSTTVTVYNLDKGMHIIGEGKPHETSYFKHYKDGSGAAYSTFMGSDQQITQVKTSTNNGRRLLLLKDSFGNALPGYLFHSFEEIHVVDYRYFTHNIKHYAAEHGITDVLFAHSVFMCLGGTAINNYNRFLNQKEGAPLPKAEPKAPKKEGKTKPQEPDSVSKAKAPAAQPAEPEATEPEPQVAPVEPETHAAEPVMPETPIQEPTSE